MRLSRAVLIARQLPFFLNKFKRTSAHKRCMPRRKQAQPATAPLAKYSFLDPVCHDAAPQRGPAASQEMLVALARGITSSHPEQSS